MSSTSTSRSRTPERPDAQVTLLTPPGIGATAVVRVSGTGAARLVEEAFHGHGDAVTCRPRNQISHGEIRSGGEYIDEVLVVRTSNPTDHPTPHPEETPGFDICTHGGIRVVERVILAFVRAGAAFVDHQQLDAGIWPASNEIEREILTALTTAGTRRSVSFLLHQRLALPQAIRRIAQTARRDRAAAAEAVRDLVDRASASHRLVAGFTLAITGPPNAGKSTLANRLAGVVGSLVSDRPGTTLDCVARETAIRGIAASLIDTPGRDDAADELVRLASARATQRLAEADVNLRVHDGSVPPPRQTSDAPEGEVPELLVLNKSDLGCVWTPEDIVAHSDGNAIRASAALGTGMEELRSEIIRVLNLEWADEQAVGLFSTRQERVAREMLSHIDGADWPEAWIDQLIGGSESGSSSVARL